MAAKTRGVTIAPRSRECGAARSVQNITGAVVRGDHHQIPTDGTTITTTTTTTTTTTVAAADDNDNNNNNTYYYDDDDDENRTPAHKSRETRPTTVNV